MLLICDSEGLYPLSYGVRAVAASTGFKQKQGARFSGGQRQRIPTLAAETIQADTKISHEGDGLNMHCAK